MTTLYASQTSNALAMVKRRGTALTFTTLTPGTYDAATDTFTSPSTATVAGYGVRVDGNPIRYQALALVQSEAPRLLFASTTAGSLPSLGASVTWGSAVYTVRDVEPIEPDGTAIVGYVIIAQ